MGILKAALPQLSPEEVEIVFEALGRGKVAESLFNLMADTNAWRRVSTAFQARIRSAATQENASDAMNAAIRDFVAQYAADAGADAKAYTRTVAEARAADLWRESWQGRLRDIQAFDALLRSHPDILAKLKAKGLDLDAEKARQRERLERENPGMPAEEAGVRATLAVYMRHRDEIYGAATDGPSRKAIEAAFVGLSRSSLEIGIPYRESVLAAKDIPFADKAAIIAATSGAGFDTKAVRVGQDMRFENAGDRYAQVWTIRPGERPEKSVELTNGPRIAIAAVPEPDLEAREKRSRAMDDIVEATGWSGARNPDGLALARRQFPKSVSASRDEALSAPNAWRAFVSEFSSGDSRSRAQRLAMVRENASKIADQALRNRMSEAIDDLAENANWLGDTEGTLLS